MDSLIARLEAAIIDFKTTTDAAWDRWQQAVSPANTTATPPAIPPARPAPAYTSGHYFPSELIPPVTPIVKKSVYGALRASDAYIQKPVGALPPTGILGLKVLASFIKSCISFGEDPVAKMWREGLGRSGAFPKELMLLTTHRTDMVQGPAREITTGLYLIPSDQMADLKVTTSTWLRLQLQAVNGAPHYIVQQWGGTEADGIVKNFETLPGRTPLVVPREGAPATAIPEIPDVVEEAPANPKIAGVEEKIKPSLSQRLAAALHIADLRAQGITTHVKSGEAILWDEFMTHLHHEIGRDQDPIAQMWQSRHAKAGKLPDKLILYVCKSMDPRGKTVVVIASGLRLLTLQEEATLIRKGLLLDSPRLCRIELQLMPSPTGPRYAIISPNQKGAGSVEIVRAFSPVSDSTDNGVRRLLTATLLTTRNRREGIKAAVRNEEPLQWSSLMTHWRSELKGGRDPIAIMWRDGLENSGELPRQLVMITRKVEVQKGGVESNIVGALHLVTPEQETALKQAGKLPTHRQVSRVPLQLETLANGQLRYAVVGDTYSGRGSSDVASALFWQRNVMQLPAAQSPRIPAALRGQAGFVALHVLASPLASGAALVFGKGVADLLLYRRLPRHWGELAKNFALMSVGSAVGTATAQAALLKFGTRLPPWVKGGIARGFGILGAVALSTFSSKEEVRASEVAALTATALTASLTVTAALKAVKDAEQMAGVLHWWGSARAASKVVSIGGGVVGVLGRAALDMTLIEFVSLKLRKQTFDAAALSLHPSIQEIHDRLAPIDTQAAVAELQEVVGALDQVIRLMAEDGLNTTAPNTVMPIPLAADWTIIPTEDISQGVDLPGSPQPTQSDPAGWRWFHFLSANPVVLRKQLTQYIQALKAGDTP